MSLLFIVLAARELRASIRFADLFYVNSNLQPEDLPSSNAIQLLATLADDVVAGGYCRSDILQTGLSVILADIDRQDAASNFDSWSLSIERADRYIRHALFCNPMDGNLWVRLAMVERASGENPIELSKLMLRSAALTPSEIGVMRARFVIWRKASAETLALSSEAIEGDLDRLLRTSTVSLIAEMLDGSSSQLNFYMQNTLASLPPERRDALEELVPILGAVSGLAFKTSR